MVINHLLNGMILQGAPLKNADLPIPKRWTLHKSLGNLEFKKASRCDWKISRDDVPGLVNWIEFLVSNLHNPQFFLETIVDGRIPAPPGMYKIRKIMG